MPSACGVKNCNSRRERDSVGLYTIPRVLNFWHKVHLNKLSEIRRDRWLKSLNRAELSEKTINCIRICSKHFIKGKPATLCDTSNPDWVPTLNMNCEKNLENENNKKQWKGRKCYCLKCDHRTNTHSCKFFTFPRSAKMKKRWMEIAERQPTGESPSMKPLMCSCHLPQAMQVNRNPGFQNQNKSLAVLKLRQRKHALVANALDVTCWAVNCDHHSLEESCSFYCYPKEKSERIEWILLSGRLDKEPKSNAHLCSCHFEDKDKSNAEASKIESKSTNLPEISEPPEKVSKRSGRTIRSSQLYKSDEYVHVGVKPKISAKKNNENSDTSNDISNTVDPLVIPEPVTEEPPKKTYKTKSTQISTVKIPVSTSTTSTQTNIIKSQLEFNATLKAENYLLTNENNKLKEKLLNLSNRFSFAQIQTDDKLITFYTGLHNEPLFVALCDLIDNVEAIENYFKKWQITVIPKADQVLLILMKLRHNFNPIDLACRFGCSRSTVANSIINLLKHLSAVFEKLMVKIPSQTYSCIAFSDKPDIISDCRIVLHIIEVPSEIKINKKLCITKLKGLVGSLPNGEIVFVSSLYDKDKSDRYIVEDCGILRNLQTDDFIITDRDFQIYDIVPFGVHLNSCSKSLSKSELNIFHKKIDKTKLNAKRVIQKLKYYKIFKTIPASLRSVANDIFRCVAGLVSFETLFRLRDEIV